MTKNVNQAKNASSIAPPWDDEKFVSYYEYLRKTLEPVDMAEAADVLEIACLSFRQLDKKLAREDEEE